MTDVLYVAPDPDLGEMLSLMFERCGYLSMYPAGSAEDALAWLSGYRADVIVSDYQLPEMTGIELLHILRSRGIEAPFIIFTDCDRAEVRAESWKNDVFGFVSPRYPVRASVLKLVRLILWATGNRDAELPGDRT
jgi:DNA-binding NtrC family response regulator